MTTDNDSQEPQSATTKPIKVIMIALVVVIAMAVGIWQFNKYTEQQMSFVRIPAGSFQMGDIQGGLRSSGKPVHRVTIAKPFYMSKTEITQAQWRAVMGDSPSKFKGDKLPVDNVSWDEIQVFISKLNQQTGKTHRLPSEAEWEYAARAGSSTKYSWGDVITHYSANYGTETCCEGLASGTDRWVNTSPVGSFRANAFGLYDMHGNVWEWTQDCVNQSYQGAPPDGSAWLSGDCSKRILRGGSWNIHPEGLRSAARFRGTASNRRNYFGFRLIQDKSNP